IPQVPGSGTGRLTRRFMLGSQPQSRPYRLTSVSARLNRRNASGCRRRRTMRSAVRNGSGLVRRNQAHTIRGVSETNSPRDTGSWALFEQHHGFASRMKPPVAGYSGTPLAKKLGVKESSRVLLVGAPESFVQLLEPLPNAVQF